MAFNPNVPQPSDNLSDSQGDLLTNFTALDNVFAINHFAFSDATANSGKHNFVEMPKLATIPAGVANEGIIYTRSANSKGASSETNLFYTPDGSPIDLYQLTRTITTDGATFATSTNYPPAVVNQNGGWTFLPGGLLFQYGTMLSTGSNTNVVFPIPFTTAIFSLSAVRKSSATEYGITNETTTGFTFQANAANVGIRFYWMAIGK